MPNEYYQDLKQKFFSAGDAEKFIEGIESLASEEDLLDASNLYAAAYVIHNKFIAKFFSLDSYNNDQTLLRRFTEGYCSLLECFAGLSYENKHSPEFKNTVINILNLIINADESQQLSLMLSSRLVNLDLPTEFCLTVVTRTNLDLQPGSQQQFMRILDHLYGNHAIWNNAATPMYMLALTPRSPPNTASMLHIAASSYCSQHANAANLVFLFYVQSCWFAAENTEGCEFIDHCLPFAVASLLLNEHRNNEWRWVLKSLAQYPKGSMEQLWRDKIVTELNTQYWHRPALLNELGVNGRCSNWLPSLNIFASCMGEDYEAPTNKQYSRPRQYG